jgi:hypothetical protein
VRRIFAPALTITFLLAGSAASPGVARADVTSWLAVGGGYGFEKNSVTTTNDRATAFTSTVGVGTSPLNTFVVGGVWRTVTHFTLGTDISLGPRLATGGFARGEWGLAVDVGVVGRFWGQGDYGRLPLQAVVTGGAPWGVQLGLGAELLNLAGSPSAQGFFAVLEIDLLRLTVDRQGATEKWWKNPSPAGGHVVTTTSAAPAQ